MSADGDKASVFRTTKVRTKLRGDNSWLQRQAESQPETEAEKPWIAEVKASRLNGANIESSPVSTPTKSQPQSSPSPLKTSTDRSPTSGFMIRGVFTKTDKTPTMSNGYSGTTQFTKKPSETYKKIAPHTVRNTENQEDQLSQDEQEQRTQAASNVLKKSAARQRSYVLSAAKIYESKDKTPDLLVNSTTSFVAQRVKVADDEESNNSTSPTTTTTVTNVTPLPKPRTLSRTSSTQMEAKEETKPKEIQAEEKTPENDPFENMVPGCTKVATPLPELIPDLVQAVYVKSDDSADTEHPESPAEEPAPKTPAPATPPPQAVTVESVVMVIEEAVRARSEPETNKVEDVGPVNLRLKEEEEPVLLVEVEQQKSPEIEVEPEPKTEPEQDLVHIQFTQIIVKEEEPEQSVEKVEVQKDSEPEILVENKDVEISVEQEPSPSINNVEPQTDDLLGFDDSGPELVQLVPSSTGPWSQDLLIPVESLSTQPDVDKEKPPVTEAQSVTETVTISTRTVIITDESEAERADPLSSHTITTTTESSSTDPFDPYPIGTTSSNSSSDLHQPLADISINSVSSTSVDTKEIDSETHMSSNVLDSLSDDIIPFNNGTTTSLSSRRSWARTWETPQPESAEESQEAAAAEADQDGEQQTVIMFERKSKENDSPWDRWMSPTVYTIDNEDDKEEEPEKSEETETQVITTVTTIRELYSEPEPSMDRILTEPEPESKKPFVFVKEYVDTSELSQFKARDMDSSSLSFKCTFCGELVGSDAKITIEHLNINCHPECFKCGACAKPMGDLLHKMFLHGGKVHCECCYRNALD